MPSSFQNHVTIAPLIVPAFVVAGFWYTSSVYFGYASGYTSGHTCGLDPGWRQPPQFQLALDDTSDLPGLSPTAQGRLSGLFSCSRRHFRPVQLLQMTFPACPGGVWRFLVPCGCPRGYAFVLTHCLCSKFWKSWKNFPPVGGMLLFSSAAKWYRFCNS